MEKKNNILLITITAVLLFSIKWWELSRDQIKTITRMNPQTLKRLDPDDFLINTKSIMKISQNENKIVTF